MQEKLLQNTKLWPWNRLSQIDLGSGKGLTLSDPMSDPVRHYDFPVPDAFPHVVQTLANS
jgi:hypothetical protein